MLGNSTGDCSQLSKQVCLADKLMPFCAVADPDETEMYYVFEPSKGTGLISIRAKRGSSKNEAVNKVIETALLTTAQLRQGMAYGE